MLDLLLDCVVGLVRPGRESQAAQRAEPARVRGRCGDLRDPHAAGAHPHFCAPLMADFVGNARVRMRDHRGFCMATVFLAGSDMSETSCIDSH